MGSVCLAAGRNRGRERTKKSGQGFVLDHAEWADETQFSCLLAEHDFFFFSALEAGGVLGSSQVQHGPLSHCQSWQLCCTHCFLPSVAYLSQSPISSFGAGNGKTSGLALQTLIAGRGKVISPSSAQLDGIFLGGEFHFKASITMPYLIWNAELSGF